MLALALLLSPVYRFPVARPVTYEARMRFDGYLPILGIGKGKATVTGTFQVTGMTDSSASVKLTAFTVTFNGEKVPIDLDDAQKYVPGGTFTFSPEGLVSAWDAPTPNAPIQVPGLDLKHLPQVLFLPVAFPTAGVEAGRSFTFSIRLSGGAADYTVTPETERGDSLQFVLKVHQSYRDFEDDANQVVAEKDAAFDVATDVAGSGTATFDSKLGRFVKYELDDLATSIATDVQTKKVTTRRLKRHLEVTS